MKPTISALVLFFILLFAYTKLAGPIPFSVTSVSTQKTDTFTVTGTGKVEVSPDIAIISAGVTANASTVKLVQSQLNEKMNAVASAIKKLGINEGDIKTSNYNIYPNYDYQGSIQKITGYQGSSNLTLKIRPIDKANEVLDAVTSAGANQVGGIQFEVDDKTKAQNDARTLAVKEAKDKAAQAARIAGFTLGKIVNYSESFGGGYPMPMAMMAKAEGARDIAAPTQVEPGSNEIVVNVSLSFDVN